MVPTEVVSKLGDKVLNSLSHLLITISEGKNVPFTLISCPIDSFRWQYVVFNKFELFMVVV